MFNLLPLVYLYIDQVLNFAHYLYTFEKYAVQNSSLYGGGW